MPTTGSEWSDDDVWRHALLGRLVETFNEAEWSLHALLWLGLAMKEPWEDARGSTSRFTASVLARRIRSLLDEGRYGQQHSVVAGLVGRMDAKPNGLIERRNRYVHGWWDESLGSDGERELVVGRLRDWITGGDAALGRYDEMDLQGLIKELDQFAWDVLDFFHFEADDSFFRDR